MNSNQTLVVVDMQRYFSAANNRNTILACKREIKEAVKNKDWIIFLQYKDCGKTYRCLTRLAAGYKKKANLIKQEDNGALEIAAFALNNKFKCKNFKICGVNTTYCVHDTIVGLRRLFNNVKIKVVADACNDSNELSNFNGFKTLSKFTNVKVLNLKDKSNV